MRTQTISIVCGGPDLWLPESLEGIIIGVDRGALALIQRKIQPHIAIGDFDSVSEDQRQLIKEKATTFIELPAEKDMTDCEAAVEYAVSQGHKEIILYGVTGGRFDHQYAVIALMLKYVKKGIRITAKDAKNEFRILRPGAIRLKRGSKKYVSFFALEEKVEGLCLINAKYPLKDHVLYPDDTLCVSNEFASLDEIDVSIDVSITKGYLLIIQSSD